MQRLLKRHFWTGLLWMGHFSVGGRRAVLSRGLSLFHVGDPVQKSHGRRIISFHPKGAGTMLVMRRIAFYRAAQRIWFWRIALEQDERGFNDFWAEETSHQPRDDR